MQQNQRFIAIYSLCILLLVPAIGQTERHTNPGAFLLISDIHFNPFYDGALFHKLDAQPIEEWPTVFAQSQPPGFSPPGADSNYALLDSSLRHAQQRIPQPDFILYPGDFMGHEWRKKYDQLAPVSSQKDPRAYRTFTTKAIQFLAYQFAHSFPATPVLPTLGNNDSYCGDYWIRPHGPFLDMFAKAWLPLLGKTVDPDLFTETFRAGGYYTLRMPHPANTRLIVLNSVFFSITYANMCGSKTDTPAQDQLQWLADALVQAREAQEKVWLLMHVPAGINAFSSVSSIDEGRSPVTFWQPALASQFFRLVEQYQDTLQMAFAGHTHMDDFRVIRFKGKATLLSKISPSISPMFRNNPGYQIFHYDRVTGALHRYRTYALPLTPRDPSASAPACPQDTPEISAQGDATSPSNSSIPSTPVWACEYDSYNQAAYGLPQLNAQAITSLSKAITSKPATAQHYTTYYTMSAAPAFDTNSIKFYDCALLNVSSTEYVACINQYPGN